MFADYPSDPTGSGVHGGPEVADTGTYDDSGNYLGGPNWGKQPGRIGYYPPPPPQDVIIEHAKYDTPKELHELRMREAHNSPYLGPLWTQLLNRNVRDQVTLDKYAAYLGNQLLTGEKGDKAHDQFMTQLGYNPLQAIGQHADAINQQRLTSARQELGLEEPEDPAERAEYWKEAYKIAGLGVDAEGNLHDVGHANRYLNDPEGRTENRWLRGTGVYQDVSKNILSLLDELIKSGGDFSQLNQGIRDSMLANPVGHMAPLPLNMLMAIASADSRGIYYDQFGRQMRVDSRGNIAPSSVDDDWNFTPTPSEGGGSEAELIQQLLNPTVSSATPAFNRQTALDELIAGTQTGTVNPGIADSYFNTIIKNGILGRNQALGEDVTQQQFEGTFGSSRLGEELLGAESGRLRDVSRGQIGDVFTGKAFEPITDDAAINNILAEKRSSAFGDISRFGARGNLSTTGGATAGEFISGREPQARTRLEEIGAGVRESGQRDIDVIRDRALQQAGTFNLGDPFFDIAPFTSERETAIQGRLPSIGPDIRSQLGAERLFDTQAAIREGAESQGLGSGAPSFLDELASRSGQRSQRNRGIGSLGSGVF